MAALDKPDWESDLSTDEQNKETAGEYYGVRLQDQSPAVAELYAKLNALTDKVNTHINSIAANTAKTGITTSQANAITANTAKTTFPGLGTSSTTALAGDTTTISTTQANEITASTTLGTKLNVTTRPASLTKSTAITFGEFTTTVVGKTTTYSIPITVVETDTSGKSAVTTTKTGSITLT